MSALTSKADIQGLAQNYIIVCGRMSAFGGKADVNQGVAEGPLLAMCGRLPVGKGFFDGDATLVGAAMCSAC